MPRACCCPVCLKATWDRADVILPAIRIYLSVLNWGKIPFIKVPQMGLADGIIRMLYETHVKGTKRT